MQRPYTMSGWQQQIMNDVVFDGSGEHPQRWNEFKEKKIGDKTYYCIRTGRFEGTLSFSCYYASEKYCIYAFDSVAHGVDWTNPNLDEEADSVYMVLKQMLATFKFTK